MSTLNILITQLGMFVIYILAGIILIRTHVLSRENMEVVSRLVIKLALPVMIFTNTVNGVDKEMLFRSLSILGIAFFMYLCLFGLSFLSSARGPSAALFCHECIWKHRIYGNPDRYKHFSGKRNALYFCVYHDRPVNAVDCRGKAHFENREYSEKKLPDSVIRWTT